MGGGLGLGKRELKAGEGGRSSEGNGRGLFQQ